MTGHEQETFILPSPAGAYYCISSNEAEPARLFLQQLMIGTDTLPYNSETLSELFKESPDIQSEVLYHIKKLKFLQSYPQTQVIPGGTIEESLPDILKLLSSNGKALLADGHGFYLSGTGFTHEAAEELSALSGDLGSLYNRHHGIIKGNLNINSGAFALVDAAGYSQLGFWPIYIGDILFMLVISGVPHLDQKAFVHLVWILHKRYFTSSIPSNFDAA